MTDTASSFEQLTPDTLREAVRLSEDAIFAANGTRLSRNDAVQRVRGRLAGYFQNAPWYSKVNPMVRESEQARIAEPLAQLIVDALPEDALDDGVLAGVDLRPYLAYVAANPQATIRWNRPMGFDRDVNVADDAQGIIEYLTSVERNYVSEQIILSNVPLDRRAALEEDELAFTSSTAGLTPSGRFVVEQRLSSSQETGMADEESSWLMPSAGMMEDETVFPQWDIGSDEVWRAVADEEASWIDDVIAIEDQVNAQRDTPGALRTYIDIEAFQSRAGYQSKRLSLTQAKRYLDQLSDSEYKQMQRRMYQAGFFDKLNKAYVEGDRFDQATAQAWDMLLLDSYKTRSPIMSTLTNRYKTRRETMAQRWTRSNAMNLLDAADAFGMDLLGRQLTTQEFEGVRSYIQGLQRQRIETGEPDWYDQNRAQLGFNEEDIRQGLGQATGGLSVPLSSKEQQAFAAAREYWQSK